MLGKLKPEEDENFQYILMKPIEINYLIDVLRLVIRGQVLCSAASTPRVSPQSNKENSSKMLSAFSSATRDAAMKVLIADDNELCRNAVVRLMERYNSNLTICEDGLKALEAFKAAEQPFNFLITDNHMPNMTGLDLIAAIRDIEQASKSVPSIHILCKNSFNLFIKL